ncbi:16S rRNA (guanine(527)-N(7))-methyltransferase RsmG [Nitrosomonas sp. JL21]|uniref:16S rRNA (guanine(527)-N(7))-methyltransferase RsmG n=1 Tax=Nitrosomonas sp. JL21 TaxID=153949 RepID=UPI001369B358|nr:16S rRNA (guanine(527)-N(7))-methyltransferase RsmG [Nitrosomonas sp. JL21]MBL8497260.1 16S rRNA (guanine(527)-N(7))-methyltransferase RsmG [Nitrosomonas sp.]MXS77129.1 16S rRNA (guanine(527)-N(7))-methyltransferase RsmG [Nitrosomonas sp. JL21]
MSLGQQIEQCLQKLGDDFPLQDPSLNDSIERYLLLIEKWNRLHNLTAIRKPQDMLVQHVMDSLAVVPYLIGSRIIDVGSGAGLPGIPIALARPDWDVILVESNQKKAAFLQQAKIELALNNVEVVARRIEDVQWPEKINVIISRAFSELGEFLRLTARLSPHENEDCRWIAMKARCSEAELAQIQPPFVLERIVPLTVPDLDAQRQLMMIRKQTR